MPELLIDNFKLAQRRDGALREDRLWSLYTLKNLDIIYVDGRLEVRKGSAYWNDTELPAEPTQIYWWRNLQGQEHLLAICSDLVDRWYVVKESGAHVLLIDELAISQCIVAPVDNRLIVGTDHNLFWTDHDAIGGATHSYRLGIKRPGEPPSAVAVLAEGNIVGVVFPSAATPNWWEINNTTRQKIAAKFQVTQTQAVRGMTVPWMWYQANRAGSIRASLHVDAAGQPGALVSEDTISNWYAVQGAAPDTYYDRFMGFQDEIELQGVTDYWLVIEADDSYYANYNGSGFPVHFYVAFGYSTPAPAGEAFRWDGGLGIWVASTNKLGFTVGGLTTDDYYDYKITYLNSTYQIESLPSSASGRIQRNTIVRNAMEVSWVASVDPQVDMVKVYRRYIGSDPGIAEDLITGEYRLVGEHDLASSPLRDTTETAYLGGVLQTDDHYCYDDTEALEDPTRPVQLVPYGGCEWKGRFWFFELNGNILYMSKVLEQDGATGMTGDSIYDFFPLENRLDMPVPSSIIAVRPISEDQLGVYFQDESVWVIWGCNEPLNPPSDIMMQPFLTDNGLIGPAAIGDMLGRHVYLSRDGLRSFGGSVAPLRGVSSETNQTILDDIQEQYLENSVIVTFGPEIWLLVDTDNDGTLDTVMILDLQREVPSREIVDRAWRMYEFPEGFNDLTVRKTGTDFRSIYASSAESNNIIELLTGTTDLGSAIACEFETHDMRAKNMAAVYELRLQGSYPGTPPVFTVQATSHAGNTISRTLSPQSSSDIRRSKTGIRINRPVSIRAKVNFSSSESDQILSLAVGFLGD